MSPSCPDLTIDSCGCMVRAPRSRLARSPRGKEPIMATRTVFYSFHYQEDAWRVQQICKINALEGQPILNSQDWEAVKRRGDQAIMNWINQQMAYKRAVVVLVGEKTASRPWVQYEIKKAWREKKPLVGIRIHGLSDNYGNTTSPGANPFQQVLGYNHNHIQLHDPTAYSSHGRIDTKQTHANIANNIQHWVDSTVTRR